MDFTYPVCMHCGQQMRKASISVDASGSGFSLTVTGVPAYACDNCATPLRLADGVNSVREITTAIISALDTLTPIGTGFPMHGSRQCRECKAVLPNQIDKIRAHFKANAKMEPGKEIIGIIFYGDALTCPRCARKHPYLISSVYHQISDAIRRATTYYVSD